MAEDQQDIPNDDEVQEAQDEQRARQDDEVEEIQGGQRPQQDRRRVYGGYRRPTCNSRLEELSKPRRWYMLSVWREYGDVFEPDRMLAFKEKIQEEFSMSPEETELYFSHLRRQIRRSQRKRALAIQLRREKAAAKLQAYQTFKLLLRQAMEYAFRHPPPPIVSPMIRRMSDTILEQLCEIHHAEMPNRDSTDKFSVFLVSVADWTAIIVGNIYYEVDVNEKVDIERMKELEQMSRTTVTKEDTKEESGKERKQIPLRKTEPKIERKAESKVKGEVVKSEKSDVMDEELEEEGEGVITEGATSDDDEEVYKLAYDEGITEPTTGDDTDTEGILKDNQGGED